METLPIFKEKILLSPATMSGKESFYINKALADNWVAPLGPNVDEFEIALAGLLKGDSRPIAMNSGTAAIHVALRMLEVTAGDIVVCQSLTFIASAAPILYQQAEPIFIDSELETGNMCPHALEKCLNELNKKGKKPKAIIVVDLFGNSAQYDDLLTVANRYGVPIIEDSAESLGTIYKGKPCGAFGAFGVFSFNGNKIVTTSGGGALITHSSESYKRALKLITQAREPAPYYLHSEVGYNYRLSNICAGIGLGQLSILEEKINHRRKVFNSYQKNLQGVSEIFFAQEPKDQRVNKWLSVIFIDPSSNVIPDDIIQKLNEHNVEARHVWKPLHTQPLFKETSFYSIESKPISQRFFDQGVCLPSGENLNEEIIEGISQIIKSCF